MKRSRRFLCIFLLVLVVLVGLSCWRIAAAVRQAQLDYALGGAVRRGDAVAVPSLLEQGADANARVRPDQPAPTLLTYIRGLLLRVRGARIQKENYPSVLLVAANDRHWDIVKSLVEHGANTNAKGKYGETALMGAAYYGDPDSVRLLLVRGAEVNDGDAFGWTALMWAVRGENTDNVVRLLLARGAEVNTRDKDGITALMWAAALGETDAVKALLKAGADIQARDRFGDTVHSGNLDIARILKQASAKR